MAIGASIAVVCLIIAWILGSANRLEWVTAPLRGGWSFL